jgi:hypothetical protein
MELLQKAYNKNAIVEKRGKKLLPEPGESGSTRNGVHVASSSPASKRVFLIIKHFGLRTINQKVKVNHSTSCDNKFNSTYLFR